MHFTQEGPPSWWIPVGLFVCFFPAVREHRYLLNHILRDTTSPRGPDQYHGNTVARVHVNIAVHQVLMHKT